MSVPVLYVVAGHGAGRRSIAGRVLNGTWRSWFNPGPQIAGDIRKA